LPVEDASIQQVAEQAIALHGRKEITQLIKDAYLLLDEMNIMTIHSFCQQTLNEFALESHQVFGAELIPSQSDIIEKYYNDFWRKYITTLPVETLSLINIDGFRNQSLDIIQQHFNGRLFVNLFTHTDIGKLY